MAAYLITKLRVMAFGVMAFTLCASLASEAPARKKGTPSAGGVDISSSVDKSEITVGDRIHYRIAITYPTGGKVDLPSVLGNLGSFEVKEYQASEPKRTKDGMVRSWEFNLSTFTVGKYVIPPQRVEFTAAGNAQPLILQTQLIEINVLRTSAETVKDIADIADLADTGGNPLIGRMILVGLALLLLLIVAGAWWMRRKRKTAGPGALEVKLPPDEEALRGLRSLREGKFIRQNREREFAFLLSEILRRYITRRFGIDALESTTTEFLAKAQSLPVTADQKAWLEVFCEKTDLIKFANAALYETDGELLIDEALEFVLQTKPRELPEPETVGARSKEQSKTGEYR